MIVLINTLSLDEKLDLCLWSKEPMLKLSERR